MSLLNQHAPDFSLPSDDGQTIQLSALQGKKVILYFYPKDDTPGCTTQACDFREGASQFEDNQIVVLGVSRDSLASHEKFRLKHGLNFPLLSDTSGEVCEKYGVWVEKSMYGKKYFGIQRTTFLIDEAGIIRKVWSPVKVPGHVQAVLAGALSLTQETEISS